MKQAPEEVQQVPDPKIVKQTEDIAVQLFDIFIDTIAKDLVNITLKQEKEISEQKVLSEQILDNMIDSLIPDLIALPQMEEEKAILKNEKIA